MDCKQAMIYYCFSCFSQMGFRSYIVKKFAYFPPAFPSYVFRPLKAVDSNESFTSQEESIKMEPIRSSSSMGEDTLRFHRVSSLFTDKSKRSQKSSKNKVHEQQNETHSPKIIKPISERKPLNKVSHELRLVTKKQQAVNLSPPDDINFTGYYLKTPKGDIIPCVHLQYTLSQSEYIILHSHGNSSDLGVQLDSYLDLCYNLGVDVLGYDYPGFGQSTGMTDDFQAIAAAETAYNFIIRELNYQPSKVILYGQSIGSGPSIMLASNPSVLIGGLIIHSGFMSALRVMCPDAPFTNQDIFPNIEYIKYVNCLVLIVHGTDDKMIPLKQAEELSKRTKKLHKLLIVDGGGHNDIEMDDKFRDTYFFTLRSFISKVMENVGDIPKLNRASLKPVIFDHVYQNHISAISENIYNQLIEPNPASSQSRLSIQIEMSNSHNSYTAMDCLDEEPQLQSQSKSLKQK